MLNAPGTLSFGLLLHTGMTAGLAAFFGVALGGELMISNPVQHASQICVKLCLPTLRLLCVQAPYLRLRSCIGQACSSTR